MSVLVHAIPSLVAAQGVARDVAFQPGSVVAARVIEVGAPTDQVVTIYRGVDRESYSCMPTCQRRVTLGDSEGYFKSTIDQAGALNNQATVAGGTTKGN